MKKSDTLAWIITNAEDHGFIYEAEMIYLKSIMEKRGDTSPYYHKLCKALDDFYSADHGGKVLEAALDCRGSPDWVAHLKTLGGAHRKSDG